MPRWIAVVSVLVSLGTPRRADACTPPPPYVLGALLPGDGATGVPTNVQVRVLHGGSVSGPAVGDIVIRPPGGAAVASSISTLVNAGSSRRVFVVRPDAPLAAHTTYEIGSKIIPGCTINCESPTYVVLGTFTTGVGPDDDPPTFAGIDTVELSRFDSCDNSACCGPYEGVVFNVKHAAASDPSGVVAYHVYRDGVRVSIQGTVGFAFCSGSPVGGGPFADFVFPGAASGRYSVHAVDLAGNQDQNDVGFDLTLPCAPPADAGVPDAAPPPPDAAPTPDAAASSSDAAPAAAPREDGSCSVGDGATALWWLLGLAGLRRRRRYMVRPPSTSTVRPSK